MYKSILKDLINIEPKINIDIEKLEIPSDIKIDRLAFDLYSEFDVKKRALGSRLYVKNLQDYIYNRYPTFTSMINDNKVVVIDGITRGYFMDDAVEFINKNSEYLESMIDRTYDFKFEIPAICLFEKSYFLRKTNVCIESPQYLLLREAVGIWYQHEDALMRIKETYFNLRDLKFTHATPIKANSMCRNAPLISCFIQKLKSDSIEGIGETFKQTMLLQKSNGGVSSSMAEIRPEYALIRSSERLSDGIYPICSILEEIAKYVDQMKKRPGAHVVVLPIWHPDIMTFISLKSQFSNRNALELFYQVWIDDLFMEAVFEDKDWYLMSPVDYKGLNLVYGDEFNKLYNSYVESARENNLIVDYHEFMSNKFKIIDRHILKISARYLFKAIIKAQGESGVPYLMNKTEVNRCSNFKEIIEGSNLCCEITLPHDSENTAVCCLGSIKVPEYIVNGEIDWVGLADVTRICVRNLNRVLDINTYPVIEAERSAMRYRAIGIGLQDLSSAFFKLRLPFCSSEAKALSGKIQQWVYYHALDESANLAEKYGPYPEFKTSKYAQGILHFDHYEDVELDDRLDWDKLRLRVKNGTYNSQLIANMPNASTSLALGSIVESVEPLAYNVNNRLLTFGEIMVVNKYLMEDLESIGLLTESIMDKIVINNGLIGTIDEIPEDLRDLYASVYEFGMKHVIDHYSERQKFVCQSQSMNVFPKKNSYRSIYKIYKYAYKMKLKTMCYYLKMNTKRSATKNVACNSCSG